MIKGEEKGIHTIVKVVKNKLIEPHKEAKLRIYYGTGFDPNYDLLEFLFRKKNSNQKIKIGSGSYNRKGLSLKLARNAPLRDKLIDQIMKR